MAYELPFILYNNVMDGNIFSVTSEEPGFPKENMTDWIDWTYWKSTGPLSPEWIIVDTLNVAVDTLAILSHNLYSGGDSGSDTALIIEQDDNTAFTSATALGSYGPTSDAPFYYTFTLSSERYIRIRIHNMEDPIFIGVAFLGNKMEIPVGPEFSFDPDMQEIQSEKYLNYSGRIVGSAIQYSERMIQAPFRRISQTFIDSDILPFLEDHYGQMIPFFFVPDPGDIFGDNKIYYLIAPDNPTISLPVYNEDIGFRNWTLIANGVRQSTFR